VRKEGVKLNYSGNSSQTVIWKRPFFIASYVGSDSSQSQLSLREYGCREKARNNSYVHMAYLKM
jgi:hypothetical protein